MQPSGFIKVSRRASQNGSYADERGTSILEFAIVVPFLVFITLALIDFGRLIIDYLIISQIVREGVRTMSAYPELNNIQEIKTKTDWDNELGNGTSSGRLFECRKTPPPGAFNCGHFRAQFRMNELLQLYPNANLVLKQFETEYQNSAGVAAERDSVKVRLTFDFERALAFSFADLEVEHRGPYLFELS